MHLLSTETRIIDGQVYRINWRHDDTHGAPWEEEDGHGPVSDWTRDAKAPGQRVLCEDHGAKRYYDYAAAVEIAKRDGWDAPPYGQGTPGQRAARAATADFERLRRWCENDWQYVGVIVTERRTDADGYEYDGPSASLWGIESDAGEYFEEVIKELVHELTAD